nr:unnamed protein product [Callosobruchus chinensis]
MLLFFQLIFAKRGNFVGLSIDLTEKNKNVYKICKFHRISK